MSGTLTNSTGRDLTDVYLVFKSARGTTVDWMIYIPDWKPGVTYDIKRDLGQAHVVSGRGRPRTRPLEGEAVARGPESHQRRTGPDRGSQRRNWKSRPFPAGSVLVQSFPVQGVDVQPRVERQAGRPTTNFYFPMLSVFSRLPPMPDRVTTSNGPWFTARRNVRRPGRVHQPRCPRIWTPAPRSAPAGWW